MRELAVVFHVSPRSVSQFLKRWRETGSVAPKPMNGGRPRKIDREGEEVIVQLVASNPDATLVELCTLFANITHISVSDTTMCDTLLELGLRRKKKRSTRASNTALTSRSSARSSR